DPEAQDLVAELVGRAGNFLTNFPAVGWLSYESLRQHGDGLVMVAITGNHDGTTAVDYTVNCAVGYPSVTGHADDPRPVNNVVPAWDLVCGQMAAVGLLAADRRRILEGVGDLVTLALSDVALATVSMLGSLAEAQLLGTQREAIGNDLYGAYGSDFPTGDGRRVMVVAISPKQWRGLQSATGTTDAVEALADELGVDFVDEGERYLARDRLGGLFGPWFAARTLAEVASGLDAEGVCWGPYRTFIEMVDEDQRCSTVNPLFADLDQPGVGRHLVCGSPLAFAGVEGRGAATAPRLGEHTEQVLADDLGLGATEIGSLVDRGVVAT
ncbi:MAG: 2-methylfumaryl-CoA isomerase, partial [Actinomycetia bacterium]|nr:2-methylfumaryl-CoA isomerase [Actinomycetes bacterium]